MKFISLLRPRYMLATQAKCIYNKNGIFRVTALDKINSFLHQIQHTHIGQITLYTRIHVDTLIDALLILPMKLSQLIMIHNFGVNLFKHFKPGKIDSSLTEWSNGQILPFFKYKNKFFVLAADYYI